MTRQEFISFVSNKLIYLDGATGSNLMKAGMPSGVCPEKWILEHKEVMLNLQKEYVRAGSNILYAPTFTANRIKLKEYNLEGNITEMIGELVAISREASGESSERVLVAGDLTMTGEQLSPMGTMTLEELIEIYKEQIQALEQAGADLLVVETMMSLQEVRAALIAAREVSDLPVMVSMTFEASGRTLFGTDAVTAAVVLESLGAAAIGANCSTGPARMVPVIQAMAEATAVPIIAKPNAGLPAIDADGNTYYDMDDSQFASEMKLLVQAGASIIGGCCGTTPEYIRLLKEVTCTAGIPLVQRRKDGVRYVSSERLTVSFSLNENFIIVGERINPTGKKKLQEQLRNGDFDMVLHFAQEQEESGAGILDINMGMSGIDEKDMMLKAISEVAGVTNLPLAIDSSHIEVMDAALRNYPGRALVNSISLEKEKFEKLLPLAAKYGSMFILLPLSDKGLPENLDEKKKIIRTIMERALELGLRKEDIVVDGLVTTVGANKNAAIETLETIRYCKEMGLATICGLSNISFGMPERSFVNSAFLTLAISAGLTMAIANPSQEMLVSCALAADLLLNKEDADIRYIEYAAQVKERREEREAALAAQVSGKSGIQKSSHSGSGMETSSSGVSIKAEVQSPLVLGSSEMKEQVTTDKKCKVSGECISGKVTGESAAALGEISESDITVREPQAAAICQKLSEAVLKGNRKGIAAITEEALQQGQDASGLLNQILLPAINLVGDYFDKGKYFLPQLIASAEAMKNAIEILEPLLSAGSQNDNMPVVILATVEGDIHDIGKNLVGLMLKNYGFRVIDLGKDVPKETIIKAARENNAQIIGLSALMTTTMVRMKEVIEFARAEGITARIMIGGAVITQEYADEIHADGYSTDAAGAVKLARRLVKMDISSEN